MHDLINLLLEFSQDIGYWGIVLLMTIESSFIPFPSEIVIPPAAYLASLGKMNIFLIILSGILGSLIGATINYILGMTLGRKLIYYCADHKICQMMLINSKKVKIAEDYFLKYGRISTLMGRLVPAVRQLISLPAGFSKMNFGQFVFYTFLGSGTWTIILAVLGYSFGANQEILEKYYKEATILAVLLVVVTIIGFIVYQKRKKLKCETITSESSTQHIGR